MKHEIWAQTSGRETSGRRHLGARAFGRNAIRARGHLGVVSFGRKGIWARKGARALGREIRANELLINVSLVFLN